MSVLGVYETCGHLIQYPIVDIYACIPLNTHDRSRVFFIVYIRIPSCEPPTFLPPYSKSSDRAAGAALDPPLWTVVGFTV